MGAAIKTYPTRLIGRQWLTQRTFEIALSKPPDYSFQAGQCVRIYHQARERDYTPVSAPEDPQITFCIRRIDSGEFTPVLSRVKIGTRFDISRPAGYFTYKPSQHPPVFIATGTGIAPFCAMARSGVTGFTLLHGVDDPGELYYRSEMEPVAASYIPCISGEHPSSREYYHGRVTAYLRDHLAKGQYDFYLCGSREMIREATWLVDEQFPGSRIYSEPFH